MQPMVSMAVPCYNKVKYVEAFFKSVYEQKWDNIELILVNNGSNDGTEKIITEWEPKLKARGYTVIRIDFEKNQGLPGAVKAGMLRASGEYFCTVDCDDELDPEYVSKMAGFLEENPEYEWACCDHVRYTDTENGRVYQPENIKRRVIDGADFKIQFLLYRAGRPTAVWSLMARMSYLIRCGVMENFRPEKCLTQETPYSIPLAVGGGKLKIFTDKLYRYNVNPTQMSVLSDLETQLDYHVKFFEMGVDVIKSLNCGEELKRTAYFIEKYFYYQRICSRYINAGDDLSLSKYAQDLAEYINQCYLPSPNISPENIVMYGVDILGAALENNILEITVQTQKPGRLIACGSRGKIGRRFLPRLINTPLEPDVLWDGSARDGEEACGKTIEKPDYDSLLPGDTVLIFPRLERVVSEIKQACSARGVTRFINYFEMLDILSAHYFPQFYGQCVFSPSGGQ